MNIRDVREDHPACREGRAHIYDPLVRGAAEVKSQALLLLYELPVHQDVDKGEQVVGDLASWIVETGRI